MTDRLSQQRLDELWDFSDPIASEVRLRAELDTAQPGSTLAGELTTQVARALGLQGRYDEADALLDSLAGASRVVAIRTALERGRLVNSSGDAVLAVPRFEEAFERAVAHAENFLAVDAAHMLAIADPGRVEHWVARGLEIIEATDDERTRRWAVALHNNKGWSAHDAGRFDEALAEFDRALDQALAHGTPEQQHIARWSRARCLRSLGRNDEALAIQEQLFADNPDDEYVVEELTILRGAAVPPE